MEDIDKLINQSQEEAPKKKDGVLKSGKNAAEMARKRKGTKQRKTIEREKIHDAVSKTIEQLREEMHKTLGAAHPGILQALLMKSRGCYVVYKHAYGRNINQVTDPKEIEIALNEHFNHVPPPMYEDSKGKPVARPFMYVVEIKEPETKALDIALDRLFGKPKETKELMGGLNIGNLLDEAEK